MTTPPIARKGRGATSNISGRYESTQRESFDDGWQTIDEPLPALRTRMEIDTARSVISYNQSPDVPFDRSINPYRGCEHGCVYCYARPTHAYLGLSPGLDFETRLFHKPDAASQLEKELAAPGYRPQVICLGANTDPYQPAERSIGLTRQIIKVLLDCKHPLRIVTKGGLIERDIDLLAQMAAHRLVSVSVSMTSLDRDLSRRMEPRAAAPQRRLRVVERLCEAGIPVHLLVAPIIPALNDEQLEAILEAGQMAGASGANYVLLRLPLEIRDLFVDWLHEHYPLKADRVMARIRDNRGGKDYDSRFGKRMKGTGVFAELIAKRFALCASRLGLEGEPQLDCSAFQAPELRGQQMRLL